jgi:peptide/nickel transport system ATP-binding protein
VDLNKDGAILSVNNLSVSFNTDRGRVRAVDGISFSLGRSSTLGIVGESGSGKSVTALSIMRLISSPPGNLDSGEILFRDTTGNVRDLASADEKSLRKVRGNDIAMIFQEPMSSLNPVFTCGDQVVEAIREHRDLSAKAARELAVSLFREVQLPRPENILSSYPHQLSGGQKQRVMIAMAMSCNPSILIADEPTTALDVTVQKSILELMKSLQARHGMSILFISHDLGVIAEIAEEVVVMYQGKIVESGSVKQVFNNPQHPYTRGLLACRPSPETRYRRLPTISDFLNARNGSDPLKALIAGPGKEKAEQENNRPVLLEALDLKTYFPVRKGLFGRTHGYVKAVDGVAFGVLKGETLGLVGESGCGKTTLSRTLLKLIEPSRGRILYKGKEITGLSARDMRPLRREMQIIFQDPYSSLNPRLPVGTAIMEPMLIHNLHGNDRTRREKAMELLEKVNLDPSYYHRYPHELSGGQRQRICIARALAVEPEFIICDESVSALDVSIQAQILNLLNDLKREFGMTYVFISHDLAVVKFMSDRIMVMKDGRIEEMGRAEQVYRNPKSSYTVRLIEAIPRG